MKVTTVLSLLSVTVGVARGFSVARQSLSRSNTVGNLQSTMAESGVPPTSSETTSTEDAEIPTNLPSDCGMDYVPLATMLATGQLAEADQVRKN